MAAKVLVVLFVALAVTWEGVSGKYYGKHIGDLGDAKPGVAGTVYCVDETTVCIVGLMYDGSGAAVTFWAGKSVNSTPDEQGEKVMFDASPDKLPQLINVTIVLKLPKQISEYNYFGLWCSQAQTSFGHVEIPTGFTPPSPQNLDLPTTKDPSISITAATLTDSMTIMLKEFKYTATAGDADTSFAVGETDTTRQDQLVKIAGKMNALIFGTLPLRLNENNDWTQFRVFYFYDFGPSSKPLLSISIPLEKALALPPNPVPVSTMPSSSTSDATDEGTDVATAAGGEKDATPAGGKVKGPGKGPLPARGKPRGLERGTTPAGGGGQYEEKDPDETTTEAPVEGSGRLRLIVILGIVGILMCIGVGLAFFFFFAPGGEESAFGQAQPGGGFYYATGDGTTGTLWAYK